MPLTTPDIPSAPVVETHLSPKEQQLLSYVQTVVLPQNKDVMSSYLGYWYPTYADQPVKSFATFSSFLSAIKPHIPKVSGKRPVFVDAGGGMGIITAHATLQGFEGYNIEVQPEIERRASIHAARLTQLGIVEGSFLHTLNGSYYTKKYAEKAAKDYLDKYHIRADTPPNTKEMIFAAESLNLESTTYKDITDKLQAMTSSVTHLDETDLVKDGKLQAEVVYSYPSDPFFNSVFPAQMYEIMHEGSLLVLIRNNGQVEEALKSGSFAKFTEIKLGTDPLDKIFIIYQR